MTYGIEISSFFFFLLLFLLLLLSLSLSLSLYLSLGGSSDMGEAMMGEQKNFHVCPHNRLGYVCRALRCAVPGNPNGTRRELTLLTIYCASFFEGVF